MLNVLAGAALTLACLAIPGALLYRQLREANTQLRSDLIGRDNRIATLERQVDMLHSQGLRIEEPVDPAAPVAALPAEVDAFLAGIEDDEARAEYEALARLRLGATDAHHLLDEWLN